MVVSAGLAQPCLKSTIGQVLFMALFALVVTVGLTVALSYGLLCLRDMDCGSNDPKTCEEVLCVRKGGNKKHHPDYCFSRTQNLNEIRCYGVTSVPEYKPIKSIVFAEMEDNDFKTITKNFFNFMDNVQKINLNSNKIQWLEKESFKKLLKLENLEAKHNKFDIFPRVIFEAYYLQFVNLDGNPITNFDQRTFKYARNLKVLSMADNRISTLKNGLFENAYNLTELNLDKNGIHIIDSNAFKGINRMIILSLSNNNILEIEKGTFEGMQQLEILNLDSNQLRAIRKHTFINICGPDRRLNLANNINLTTIEQDAFNISGNMFEIDLRNTSVTCTSVKNVPVLITRPRIPAGEQGCYSGSRPTFTTIGTTASGPGDCEQKECDNGGTCINENGAYICYCTDGWEGKFCENDIDECAAKLCENKGYCQNLHGSFECTCRHGWVGDTCSIEESYTKGAFSVGNVAVYALISVVALCALALMYWFFISPATDEEIMALALDPEHVRSSTKRRGSRRKRSRRSSSRRTRSSQSRK